MRQFMNRLKLLKLLPAKGVNMIADKLINSTLAENVFVIGNLVIISAIFMRLIILINAGWKWAPIILYFSVGFVFEIIGLSNLYEYILNELVTRTHTTSKVFDYIYTGIRENKKSKGTRYSQSNRSQVFNTNRKQLTIDYFIKKEGKNKATYVRYLS